MHGLIAISMSIQGRVLGNAFCSSQMASQDRDVPVYAKSPTRVSRAAVIWKRELGWSRQLRTCEMERLRFQPRKARRFNACTESMARFGRVQISAMLASTGLE